MSDTVLAVLIIAVAVVLVLFALRARLGLFSLKASRGGLSTKLTANAPTPVPGSRANTLIQGNTQEGIGHKIDIKHDAVVQQNVQRGVAHTIGAGPDSQPGGKTR